MYFVLPGKDGAPVETLRYEALRRAIQDYELLRLADRTVGEEEKATLFEKVREKAGGQRTATHRAVCVCVSVCVCGCVPGRRGQHEQNGQQKRGG